MAELLGQKIGGNLPSTEQMKNVWVHRAILIIHCVCELSAEVISCVAAGNMYLAASPM